MKNWCFAAILAALCLACGPLSAQPAVKSASTEKTDAPGKVKEVITEGVGLTVEDALKDAFRSAVREVIGAVVEQETRLKNDEVIADQVLTASGGFVAGYERLKTEKVGGLVRIRIKARVERAELVDKLRALKITVQDVDQARLLPDDKDRRFSDERVKAMTQEEMVANKTEVVHDALLDLPKVLDARAKKPDRFDYNAEEGILKVEVVVSADSERYAQYLKRLQLRLDKLSLDRKFVTLSGKPADLNALSADGTPTVPGFFAEEGQGLAGPDLTRQPKAWCLWLLTQSLKEGSSLRWTGYLLDADVRKCISGLHGELQVRVTLRDKDDKAITEETLDLVKGGGCWLGTYHLRTKETALDEPQHPVLTPATEELAVTQQRSANLLLAPMNLYANYAFRTVGYGSLSYAPSRSYPLKVKLDKDEVKRLKDIRCEVQFRAAK